jgi:hypothetical protein
MTEANNMTVPGLYIIQKLRQSLPINDLVAWLIEAHPEAELKQILSMLNIIYQEGFKIVPATQETKVYPIGDRQLTAYPQRVEVE